MYASEPGSVGSEEAGAPRALLNGKVLSLPEDGTAFDSEPGRLHPKVTARIVQAYGQAEIRVADNGRGVPEEIRDRIFELFVTTKPRGSGAGLGLLPAHDIVTQAHRGRQSVKGTSSRGGRGRRSRVRRRRAGRYAIAPGCGRWLVGARIALGLTQQEMADRLEVSAAQVSRDERNDYHGITVERGQRILEALGVRFRAEASNPVFADRDPSLEYAG